MAGIKPSHSLNSVDYVAKLARNGLPWRTWYAKAIHEIESVCLLEQWPIDHFTSVLAILSPRCSVRRNIRGTLVYNGQNKLLTNTLPNVKRSLEIYLDTGRVGGSKVSCFCKALLGDDMAITLDTWMAYALLDMESPHIKYFERINTRTTANTLVCVVANMLDLSPRDCQAAIWCGMFLESGQIPQFFPVMEEYENWIAHDRRFPLSGVISSLADEIKPDSLIDDTSFDVESFVDCF